MRLKCDNSIKFSMDNRIKFRMKSFLTMIKSIKKSIESNDMKYLYDQCNWNKLIKVK